MIKRFDDGSYLEIKVSAHLSDEVVLSLCSIDSSNNKNISVTSVAIQLEELKLLVDKVEDDGQI